MTPRKLSISWNSGDPTDGPVPLLTQGERDGKPAIQEQDCRPGALTRRSTKGRADLPRRPLHHGESRLVGIPQPSPTTSCPQRASDSTTALQVCSSGFSRSSQAQPQSETRIPNRQPKRRVEGAVLENRSLATDDQASARNPSSPSSSRRHRPNLTPTFVSPSHTDTFRSAFPFRGS